MKATIVYEGKATKEFDEMFNFAKKKLSKLEFKRKKSSTNARFVLYYKDLVKVVYPNEKNEPLHKAIVRELANYGFKYGNVDISKEKNFSENALTVLQERYLLKDETRKPIETPEQLFRRVARNLAFVDLLYGRSIEHCEELAEKFFQIMYNKYFLPNTPTLANAGKPNSLLSACFVLPVEDSIESIFNSARDGALVHKQGGGCIEKGSRVFTTHCGIEKIDELFEKLSQNRPAEIKDGAIIVDVSDLNIKVPSMTKEGKLKFSKLEKIWKYKLPKEKTLKIICEGNLEACVSEWHKFFVFENCKIVEKRADELKIGDLLILPNPSLLEVWPFKKYKKIKNFVIDENLAWLLGFFLCDGSLSKNRIRFFTKNKEIKEKISKIVEKVFGRKYAWVTDKRTGVYYTNIYRKEIIELFEQVTSGLFGEKTSVRIPEFIFKSKLSVIFSFLAGVIDGDGYVNNSKRRLEIGVASLEFIEDLLSLFYLLGFKARYAKKVDKRNKNWKALHYCYVSSFYLRKLSNYLLPYLVHKEKRKRLKGWCKSDHISVNSNSKVSKNKRELEMFSFVIQNLTKVKKIVRGGSNSLEFYDFTVAENNNYLAGKHGLAVIHNTGYAFSRLRPEGSLVKTTGGRASGPVSFMYAFNVYTDVVKQGGIRRGANMGVLNVHHPDIMKFINAKVEPDEKARKILNKLCQLTGLDENHPFIETTKKLLVENYQLNNFNISVAVTDRFMEALAKNEDYELIDPRNNEVVGKLSAAEVFEAICKNTWLRGDPGIVFIDRVNKDNPTPAIGKIESTNPCGEQPLLPYESCNLGSINLSKFVKDNGIDWQKLREVVRLAVHFLDNVIDANSYPIKQIEIMTKANRKIGLGVMGWADMLIDLGISYASNEALELAERVMSFIKKEALEKSKELAKEKGVFPNWEKSVFKEKNIKLRNATLTTIAPTGSISMIADCSAGVEPLFSLAYIKTVLGGKQLRYVNERFIKLAKERGFYSKELEEEILEKGNLSNVNNVPDDVKKLFVTALEIPAEWHIKMQAAFQKYTDNAVSKTINLPEDASVEDIKKCYLLAYELGCKGLTIYRDKSLFEQVVSFKVKDNEVFFRTKPKERPAVVYGMTRRIRVPCGNLFITINLDENKEPFEVFITAGKAGGCLSANTEAIGRLISYILRTNPDSWTHLENIIGQLRGIGCGREVGFGKNKVLSCPDAVAIELYKFLVEAGKVKDELPEKFDSENFESPFKQEKSSLIDINIQMGACPNCGSPLIFQEGCAKCTRCNYTQCD